MSLTVKWDITYKCNLNCAHCLNGDLLYKVEDELTTEGVKQVLDSLAEVNIYYVHLLGGEPTARRDIVEITDYFAEKKIGFGINTNGLKLGTPEMDQIIANPYLRNIVISLEGPTAEINDSIRGKSVFEKVTQGLRKVIETKKANNYDHFYTTINTVLSKQNYDYIPAMFDFCAGLGVDEFNILEYIATGNADKTYSLTFLEEQQLLPKISEKYVLYKDQMRFQPKFLRPLAVECANDVMGLELPQTNHACGAGTKFAFLNNRGELYPCDRYVKQISEQHDPAELRLNNHSFYEVWEKEHYGDLFELTFGKDHYAKYDPCTECHYLRKTCFPCPVHGMGKELQIMGKCRAYMALLKEHQEEGDQCASR